MNDWETFVSGMSDVVLSICCRTGLYKIEFESYESEGLMKEVRFGL